MGFSTRRTSHMDLSSGLRHEGMARLRPQPGEEPVDSANPFRDRGPYTPYSDWRPNRKPPKMASTTNSCLTRRTLIQGLAILLMGLVASIWLISPKRLLRVISRLTVNLLGPRVDASSATGVLEPAELDSVVAFAEVLVEGVPLPPEGLQILVEHVNRRTRTTPGYLSLYRAIATTLDRLANRPFSALDLPERTAVIMEHGLAHPV